MDSISVPESVFGRALSEADAKQLEAGSFSVRFETGESLVRQGDEAGDVFFLLEGRVEVRHRSGDGSCLVLGSFGAGDLVGERAILTSQRRTADVVALTDVHARRVPRQMFLRHLEKSGMGLAVCSHLAAQLGNWSQKLATEVRESRAELTSRVSWQILPEFESFPGSSPWTREFNQRLKRIAPQMEPVLIQGEAGTWKELVARLVHYHCGDPGRPIHQLNCLDPPPILEGTLPEELEVLGAQGGAQMAALFGHAPQSRGYVQGSTRGCLELAEGGDLLLEQVECLHEQVQASLFRALSERGFTRIGERNAHDLRVRIIATTELDLEAQVRQGRFHPGLYRAISSQVVRLLPLRERLRDLPEMVRSLLPSLNRKHHRRVRGVSQGAMNKLVSYDWPLNGHELQLTLDRAVALCRGEELQEEDIALELKRCDEQGPLNLMRLPVFHGAVKRFPWLWAPKWFASAAFLLILVACLELPDAGNWGNVLVWGLWWPSLLVLVLLFSRIWCSFCPLNALASLAGVLRRAPPAVPPWLKRWGASLASVGIFALLLTEQVLAVPQSPFATAVLLASLLGMAVVTQLFFGPRVWCRFLCPLGRFLGQMTRLSYLKLRSTPSVCLSQCRSDDCVRRGKCPMELHPAAPDDSGQCILCFDCVRACPHDAIRLDVRFPWQGLLSPRLLKKREIYLVLTLLAFMPSLRYAGSVETAAQKTGLALGIFALLLCCYFLLGAGGGAQAPRRFALASFPLVFSSFAVFYGELALRTFEGVLVRQGRDLFTEELQIFFQVLLKLSGFILPLLVVATGLGLSLLSLEKLWRQASRAAPWAQRLALLLAALTIMVK